MGNSFFCNRCDIDKFQLSRACADQFLNDDEENKITSEERWRLKLKCLDDVHSKQNGLTEEAFNELINRIEKKLQSDNMTAYCSSRDVVSKKYIIFPLKTEIEKLIDCLRHNPHCMLNCQREMNDFIDCVDTIRLRRIKERIHESTKKKI